MSVALEVASQHCEHLRNPQNIDTTRPRLSWTLLSDERGDRQTAYRLQVASSAEKLASGSQLAWDTGRVDSQTSSLVPYNGRPLKTHEKLYWRVRVWDAHGNPSKWSQAAEWQMGVLDDTRWGGQWIGKQVAKRIATLSQSKWIWFPEGEPSTSAALGERWFRRSFTIPTGREITSATFRIAADDHVQINLNGRDLGTRSGPSSTKELEVGSRLQHGKNTIAVCVSNRGDGPNPAGLVAWLKVEFSQGDPLLIVSDGDWVATSQLQQGWQSPTLDDSAWKPVMVLGEVGMAPWGQVRHAESRRLPARYLRTSFEVDKPVSRAVVSFCGLGCSELYVNGKKAGDQVLSPGMTEYPKRCYYITRDVTDLVRQGKNAVGAVLGNGRFYAPRSEVYAGMPTYGAPKLLLKLTIDHPDGQRTVVRSDSQWRLTDQGPIRANNEYDGEAYDARRELPGWSSPEFNDDDWQRVDVLQEPGDQLEAEPVDPLRVTQTLRPVAITEPRPGVYVFDLGQNMVGWCRLKVEGPAGATVRLRHAETLTPDGELYIANLRGAKATDYYTLKGDGKEEWAPRFTIHGFRYVEVTGLPGDPTQETITGCVVHDDLESVGEFKCASNTINQVYQNARWGIRGNYRSVPTDCPQRDERQGWLGDRLETARSESYLFNVAAFYSKWLQDIRDSQLPSGSLPDIAPTHWARYQDDVVWPSASILLPSILLRQYGDRQVLLEHYESCVRWADYMRKFVRDDGLIDRDSYGDWCVPPESPQLIHSEDPQRKTDTTLLASAFYYHDLKLLESYSKTLEKPENQQRFARDAQRMREAINKRFLDQQRGQYSNGTQTSSVLPLAFGIPPESVRPRVVSTLVEHVSQRDGFALATGLVGAQFLCRTLTDIGRPDLAYRIAAREEYPSWGYMANQGATTIWELWNGNTADPAMNSGNHVMLIGDLITWLYEDLAGVAPHPQGDGFTRLLLRPNPPQDLEWAEASFASPSGRIESRWERTDRGLVWRVLVPPGATAEAHLPAASLQKVTESDMPLADAVGVKVSDQGGSRVVVELESGRYEFTISE